MRATLTLDLAAVQHNFEVLQARCSEGVAIDPVLKAEAYGLGMRPILDLLYAQGCRRFYFADWESVPERSPTTSDAEFFSLNGVIVEEDARACLSRDIVPVLNSLESWRLWQSLSRAPYALHIDTGMNRLGLNEGEAHTIAQTKESRAPSWLLSHLACADEPANPYNAQQLRAFQSLAPLFPRARKSLANSSGIFLGAPYHFDAVRPGAALYGLNPLAKEQTNPMVLAVSLTAPIIQLRTIDAGQSVGYARVWRAPSLARIAICPCGYGDGYPFRTQAQQSGYALVNGQKAQIRGRVSMDFIAIDVTAAGKVQVGDQAVLMSCELPPRRIADSIGDLDYNILLQLSRGVRARRITIPPPR